MGVPHLGLNLAPQPNLWRQQHQVLGWAGLSLGALCLLGALGVTWRAYHQAGRAGREAVNLAQETRRAARQEKQIQATLQDIDADKEQSRWQLAERILEERSLPWSRLTAELERCMVPDMRLRSIQRARGAGQQVVMKLKGEARTVAAEDGFISALRSDPVFEQVILEREGERQGGGWDFELTLPVVPVPPPFRPDPPIQPKPAAAAKTPPKPEPPPAKAPPKAAQPPQAPAGLPAATPAPGPAAPPPALQGAPETFRARPAVPHRRRPGHRTPDLRGDRSSE